MPEGFSGKMFKSDGWGRTRFIAVMGAPWVSDYGLFY